MNPDLASAGLSSLRKEIGCDSARPFLLQYLLSWGRTVAFRLQSRFSGRLSPLLKSHLASA